MLDHATRVPPHQPDLVITPSGNDGNVVVKNPRTGEYFQLGPHEGFLLEQLHGRHSANEICESFRERFGEPLSADELDQFVRLARARNLVSVEQTDGREVRRQEVEAPATSTVAARPTPAAGSEPRPRRGGVEQWLFWRKRLLDPHPLFAWLHRRLRLIWSPAFVVLSMLIVTAGVVVGLGSGEAYANHLAGSLNWETLAMAWLAILLTAALHEAAHGLTCEHFGGEVRETGFLLMFLMPSLYCNVSDAWLFREKSKRLWVMFAGTYCDLVVSALALITWRVTLEGTTINHVAWVVTTVTALRSLLNLIPLLKLDGYYLLSDWLEIPNLRQRSLDSLTAHVRWLLWGAPRPVRRSRGRLLFWYGAASWLFSVLFLVWTAVGLSWFLRQHAGPMGMAGIRIAEWCGGPMQLAPTHRAEVRAPIAGFIAAVEAGEGDEVSPGRLLVRVEVPDLASKLAQKRAELREAEADLQLLLAGSRQEKIAEEEQHVEEAQRWQQMAAARAAREQTALDQDLLRLDQLIVQRDTEYEQARRNHARKKLLRGSGAITAEEYEDSRTLLAIADSLRHQARSERAARVALGVTSTERDLAIFEKELFSARSGLTLMKLGPRPEEL
ncbi:MAG: hypothetical protein ACYC6Y_16665, partial [Thermoguttaceae bacterium]